MNDPKPPRKTSARAGRAKVSKSVPQRSNVDEGKRLQAVEKAAALHGRELKEQRKELRALTEALIRFVEGTDAHRVLPRPIPPPGVTPAEMQKWVAYVCTDIVLPLVSNIQDSVAALSPPDGPNGPIDVRGRGG